MPEKVIVAINYSVPNNVKIILRLIYAIKYQNNIYDQIMFKCLGFFSMLVFFIVKPGLTTTREYRPPLS